LFVPLYANVITPDPSYGELAKQTVPTKYEAAVNLLTSLTDSSMPEDGSIKELRKSLLYSRDMLDIFAYAYPNETVVGKKRKDVWLKLRGDLDDGYTTIGSFKDLAGVSYTTKELNKRRNACLQWRSDFQQDANKNGYSAFVNAPSTEEIFLRPADELSEFYWQYVNVYPKFSLSGLQNIAALEKGLVGLAVTNFTQLVGLTAPYKEDAHEFMHDYRKLMRSITTVASYFDVFQKTPCVVAALGSLDSIYDLLGNINDEIVAYEYYVQHDQTNEASQKQQQIVADWSSFLSWLNQRSMSFQFQCLSSNLVNK